MVVGIVDPEVFCGVGLWCGLWGGFGGSGLMVVALVVLMVVWCGFNGYEFGCEFVKKIQTKMLNVVTISLKVKTKMGI